MYKAKLLIGEKAGEVIYARDSDLTHDLCRLWKIYCPECKQFLYFNESKNSDKRDNWFSHYDYPDKKCPERNSSTNDKFQQGFSSASREQDLETAESFIEQVFYGIDLEFFQRKNLEEIEDDSSLVISSVKWLQENLQRKCHSWINYYCRTTEFLDWENPSREVDYLMDWLYVLARRDDVLKNLTYYSICIYTDNQENTSLIQKRFNAVDLIEEEWISIIILDMIIKRLEVVARDGVSTVRGSTTITKIYVELTIPPNKEKTPFKGKLSKVMSMSLSTHIREGRFAIHGYKSGNLAEAIFFDRRLVDSFFYLGHDELGSFPGFDNVPEEDFLSLYVNEDGELSIKGFANERHYESIIKGISKILFNKSDYSMLLFLREGFISENTAEKAAQLALKATHENLTSFEALEEFRALSRVQLK